MEDLKTRIGNIDWDEIRRSVLEKPEMKQLEKEIEYLQTTNDIFEGKVRRVS